LAGVGPEADEEPGDRAGSGRQRPAALVEGAARGAARLVAAIEGPSGPRLAWTLRGYRGDRLQGDVTGGLALAALIIPLSIGYAAVAGLPPEMGLYASLAPLLAYAVLGSGRSLVIGPDAASASMIAATIAPLAASQDDRVRLAGLLGIVVAGVFVAMVLLRLGFLADLLSRPILVGYLAGVGLTVAVGQIPKLMGGPAFDAALGVLQRIDWATADPAAVASAVAEAVRASGADLVSLAVGVSVLVAMLVGRRVAPRIPMALVVMVGAVAVSWVFELQSRGVKVLGPVPGGLPPIGLPQGSLPEVLALLPGAIGLAMLTFADTAATGKNFAALAGERTDPNRELAALALADAAASITGGYPVSSSGSRTSAVRLAGGTTQLAGIIAAAAVMVALLLLTGPLSYLPTPALGAVVLFSALGIVDVAALRQIWRLKPSEGLIALIALSGVVLYGTLIGVALAVLLATLNIVRRAAVPPIVEVGRRLDGTWRDIARWGDAQRLDGVAVVRFAGPLFFASVTGLDARVRALVAERPGTDLVVLDLSATSDIDLTASAGLRLLAADLRKGGCRLVLARPLGHVLDALVQYGLEDLMLPGDGTKGTVDEVVAAMRLDAASLALAEEAGADAEAGAGAGAAAVPAPADEGLPGQPIPAGAAAATSSPSTVSAQEAGKPPAGAAPDGNRLVLRVVGIAAASVVAAGVLSLVLGAIGSGPGIGPAPVPNLVGMAQSRASVAASDAGFVLGEPVYIPREDQPEGTVVAQDPPAGTISHRGATIQPTVSTGRPIVVVPDVVGLSESQAIVVLTGAGFGVSRTATVSDASVPTGAVVSTEPSAGTLLTTGLTVGYVVSSGPAPAPGPTAAPEPPAAPSPTATASASPSVAPPPASAPPDSGSPSAFPSSGPSGPGLPSAEAPSTASPPASSEASAGPSAGSTPSASASPLP